MQVALYYYSLYYSKTQGNSSMLTSPISASCEETLAAFVLHPFPR